jgi:hypothetical protein
MSLVNRFSEAVAGGPAGRSSQSVISFSTRKVQYSFDPVEMKGVPEKCEESDTCHELSWARAIVNRKY